MTYTFKYIVYRENIHIADQFCRTINIFQEKIDYSFNQEYVILINV